MAIQSFFLGAAQRLLPIGLDRVLGDVLYQIAVDTGNSKS